MKTFIEIFKGSLLLYKWDVSKSIQVKSLNVIKNVNWTFFMYYTIIITLLTQFLIYYLNPKSSFSIISSFNLTSQVSIINLLIVNLITLTYTIGTVFIGYYFTKLFFQTKLTEFEFYKYIIYIYMPISLASLIFLTIASIDSGNILIYVILVIPLIYLGLVGALSLLRIMSEKFNTSQISLFFVVLLWGIITSILSSLILKPFIKLFL